MRRRCRTARSSSPSATTARACAPSSARARAARACRRSGSPARASAGATSACDPDTVATRSGEKRECSHSPLVSPSLRAQRARAVQRAPHDGERGAARRAPALGGRRRVGRSGAAAAFSTAGSLVPRNEGRAAFRRYERARPDGRTRKFRRERNGGRFASIDRGRLGCSAKPGRRPTAACVGGS